MECIYVVVYRLTKYAHLFSIPSKYNTSQVADIFSRDVFKLHGLPRYIVSDRDKRFLNTFWKDLFRLARTKLTPSTNYHPQTYGKMKIMTKWIEGYLWNYVSGQ
jgi:hypothetical protein